MFNTDALGPVLVLYYRKKGHPGQYKMTIPFSELDDKSEEEILDAIKRFYQLWLETVTPLKQPFQLREGNL